MAGTINFAMTQQLDTNGRPLSGGLLYFFVAGTTTPQSAYIDTGLTLPHPNPIVLDSGGRVPMFYLADGSIKIRLTDRNGITIIAEDNLLVVGPSAGGGGGGGAVVDSNALLQTGDIKARYGTGTLPGFVRCNGNSIGLGGGTEAFGSQYQALFEYLWQFPNITLNVAKGATANADWLAGRTLNLPDLKGRVIAGMDDMGATAAGRLTLAGLGVSGTVLGNAGAAETAALVTGNLPDHAHTGTIGSEAAHTHTVDGATGTESVTHTHTGTSGAGTAHQHDAFIGDDGHTHNIPGDDATGGAASGGRVAGGINAESTLIVPSAVTGVKVRSTAGTAASADQKTATESAHTHPITIGNASVTHTHSISFASAAGSSHTHSFTSTGTTGALGTAFSKVQPTMVLTFYMRL